MSNRKKSEPWFCPVCSRAAGSGTFVCTKCRLYVHPQCGEYTNKNLYSLVRNPSRDVEELRCNDCKVLSTESLADDVVADVADIVHSPVYATVAGDAVVPSCEHAENTANECEEEEVCTSLISDIDLSGEFVLPGMLTVANAEHMDIVEGNHVVPFIKYEEVEAEEVTIDFRINQGVLIHTATDETPAVDDLTDDRNEDLTDAETAVADDLTEDLTDAKTDNGTVVAAVTDESPVADDLTNNRTEDLTDAETAVADDLTDLFGELDTEEEFHGFEEK